MNLTDKLFGQHLVGRYEADVDSMFLYSTLPEEREQAETSMAWAYRQGQAETNADLLAVLEAVEWPVPHVEWARTCFQCGGWRDKGHADDCIVGNAVKAARKETNGDDNG